MRSTYLRNVRSFDSYELRQQNFIPGSVLFTVIKDDIFRCGKSCCWCFRRSGVTLGNNYGGGSGQIWLDNLQCTGNEMSLAECTHRGWGVHSCYHYEDVSIACGTNITCKYRQLFGSSSSSIDSKISIHSQLTTLIKAILVCFVDR